MLNSPPIRSRVQTTHGQHEHKPHPSRTPTSAPQSAHKPHTVPPCRPHCRTIHTRKQTTASPPDRPLDTEPRTPRIHHQTATMRWMYIRLMRPHSSPVGAPHQAWEHRAALVPLCTTSPNACDFHWACAPRRISHRSRARQHARPPATKWQTGPFSTQPNYSVRRSSERSLCVSSRYFCFLKDVYLNWFVGVRPSRGVGAIMSIRSQVHGTGMWWRWWSVRCDVSGRLVKLSMSCRNNGG